MFFFVLGLFRNLLFPGLGLGTDNFSFTYNESHKASERKAYF